MQSKDNPTTLRRASSSPRVAFISPTPSQHGPHQHAHISLKPDDEPPSIEPSTQYLEEVEEAIEEELPTIKSELTWKGVKRAWVGFWKELPTQIWALHADCFLIAAYRKEWGKFCRWSYDEDDGLALRPMLSLEQKQEKLNKKRRASFAAHLHGRYTPHDWTGCEPITINVSGVKFITQLRTLKNFPDSLLGSDKKRKRYFNPATKEYFFDRHASCFEAILHYFQTNGRELNRPPQVPLPIFEEEFAYYEIENEELERLRAEEGYFKDLEQSKPKNLLQRKLCLLFEYPESSFQAKIVAFISVSVILLSILIFCLETLQGFSQKADSDDMSDPFYLTEAICMIWFCFEITIRFAVSPSKIEFVKDPMNIVDVLAIIPFFFQMAVYHIKMAEEKVDMRSDDIDRVAEDDAEGVTLGFLTCVRLVRVLRIFKLSRHSKGLKILARTLHASIRELGLLVFFLSVGTILFSSALYFAELDPTGKSAFTSIPDAFFFGITTMTTIGYGTEVPYTFSGKLIGSVCALVGVLTLALPVPVIVANFNYFYHRESDVKYEQLHKVVHKFVHVCPDRPECVLILERGHNKVKAEMAKEAEKKRAKLDEARKRRQERKEAEGGAEEAAAGAGPLAEPEEEDEEIDIEKPFGYDTNEDQLDDADVLTTDQADMVALLRMKKISLNPRDYKRRLAAPAAAATKSQRDSRVDTRKSVVRKKNTIAFNQNCKLPIHEIQSLIKSADL